jgi:hypothetical protein
MIDGTLAARAAHFCNHEQPDVRRPAGLTPGAFCSRPNASARCGPREPAFARSHSARAIVKAGATLAISMATSRCRGVCRAPGATSGIAIVGLDRFGRPGARYGAIGSPRKRQSRRRARRVAGRLESDITGHAGRSPAARRAPLCGPGVTRPSPIPGLTRGRAGCGACLGATHALRARSRGLWSSSPPSDADQPSVA